MHIYQEIFEADSGWKPIFQKGKVENPKLVLAFGNRGIISDPKIFEQVQNKYPLAEIVMSSTSGEILDTNVIDDSISLTCIEFEHTELKSCCVNIRDFKNSEAAAIEIVNELSGEDLTHIFIVADGQLINGTDLVKGLNTISNENVAATGGLAGDGYDFNKTAVGLNLLPEQGNIVAIGFYGNRLKVSFSSKGGWDAFGPQRMITKSEGNVLYELDGQSALDLYKKYLGDAANELPSSALFYPLSIHTSGGEQPIVRTILSIDEDKKSMTFAGNIPQGTIAQLMKHNADKLVDGAEAAAENCMDKLSDVKEPELAILVSCVGRKIVLGQNIEEEVEVIRDLLGTKTAITGFYSYGEIAPFKFMSRCELHNQTMTITTFTEI